MKGGVCLQRREAQAGTLGALKRQRQKTSNEETPRKEGCSDLTVSRSTKMAVNPQGQSGGKERNEGFWKHIKVQCEWETAAAGTRCSCSQCSHERFGGQRDDSGERGLLPENHRAGGEISSDLHQRHGIGMPPWYIDTNKQASVILSWVRGWREDSVIEST